MYDVALSKSLVQYLREILQYNFAYYSNSANACLISTSHHVPSQLKFCACHQLLLTLETMLIKLQRHFNQTTSAFIRF